MRKTKEGSAVRNLGCSVEFFKEYLALVSASIGLVEIFGKSVFLMINNESLTIREPLKE